MLHEKLKKVRQWKICLNVLLYALSCVYTIQSIGRCKRAVIGLSVIINVRYPICLHAALAVQCPLFAFLANVNSRSRSLYAIARSSVVCLSVVCLSVCLSVTFVRPTQAAQIFGNISTALGTLAIPGHPLKILRRSSQGNPSAGGVEHKRGSKI